MIASQILVYFSCLLKKGFKIKRMTAMLDDPKGRDCYEMVG
jgi:hypothetical protein